MKMVGKKNLSGNTASTTKRSPVASEPALANRPRRNISPKNLDLTAGLSWREERELKKALYASLQETKKCPIKSESVPVPIPTSSITRRSHGSYTATHTMTRRQSPRSTKPVLSAALSHMEHKSAKLRNAFGIDESSQDSTVSSQTSVSCSTEDTRSKMKVRAQRKFAQMMAYGNSMTPQLMTPVKQSSKASPIKVFPKRAKTEDFLTFLCLRGTQVLPPHLDFFNFSRDDGDSSCPATPSNGGRPGSLTRESSPCSSSTSTSNVDFENILGRVTPIRKAARACAGTPETARGFASIGPGSRTRNGSSHISKKRQRNTSPAVTPLKGISPRKMSPLKRGKGISPRKTGTSDRLSIKKKALATLRASKMSPAKKQDRKKSLFSDSGSLATGKREMQKKLSVKNLRKSHNRGLTKSKRSTKLEKSTGTKKKATTSFIADRLPKRQAKLRGYRYFLEEDELDSEVLCLKDTSPDRSKQRSPSRKRKSDAIADEEFDSPGPSIKVSVKKARIRKVEKKSIKAKSHGKILLRQIKNIKKKNSNKKISSKFVKVSESVSEMSSGIHTRSGSVCRPEDVNNPVHSSQGSSPSNSSVGKVKLTKRPPKIENLRDKSVRICEKKVLNKNIEKQLKKIKGGKTFDELNDGITFSRVKNKLSTMEIAVKKRRKSPVKAKVKPEPTQKDVKFEPFPSPSELARIVEAPVFFPTEEDFADPMKYIQNISMTAEPFGMCRIIPPSTWKPDGKISDETRFTTQKQYVHKMFQRYGPNVRQFKMIKKHLESLGVSEPVPVIGGVEIDLCKLSAIIEDLGGMQYVVEKKKWLKVADAMGISKAAQDRGTRLYEAYCKFLVSYDTLSDDEKSHLEDEVEEERDRVEDIEDEDECIVKGKNMPLPTFIRTSRNIASMWLKDEVPVAETVEREYWRILQERSNHIVVHGGHVDTQTHHCSLFASKKESHCYRHPWNLNNLPHKSILKYLGRISGVTVPTLRIGMPFTTSCWSSDKHNLPYVQYLHSESEIVWYSIPCHEEDKFKTAMATLAPTLVSEGVRWLREDTVMVPPDALTMNDVSVSRCVQRPGQFVIVFPRSYTATISCGYTLAESVHYGTPDWIQFGMDAVKTLYSSHEKELFSVDELLCRILEDTKASKDLIINALSAFQIIVAVLEPHVLMFDPGEISSSGQLANVPCILEDFSIDDELRLRQQLSEAGLKASRRMCTAANLAQTSLSHSRRASCDVEEIISICDTSKKICYLSLVLNEADDMAFSLEHGLAHIQKKRNIKSCKLMYRHTEDELKKIISDAKERLCAMETTGSETSPRRKQQRKLEMKN